MQEVCYKIPLDLTRGSVQASITVKKGDTKTRRIEAMFNVSGAPFSCEGCTAVFRGRTPAGQVLYNECTATNGTVHYTLTNQTIAQPGVVQCEFNIYKNDAVLASPRFEIVVEDTIGGDEQVEGSDEFTALSALVGRAQEAIGEMEQGLAEGRFDGVGIAGVSMQDDCLYVQKTDGGVFLSPPLRGEKGDRGEAGVSPVVRVHTDTPEAYSLEVEQAAGKFVTPNLRGRDGLGAGDMLQAHYDSDGDGTVDGADYAAEAGALSYGLTLRHNGAAKGFFNATSNMDLDIAESDPTVPSWAKQAQKPAYSPQEVGAAPLAHYHTGSATYSNTLAQAGTELFSGPLSVAEGETYLLEVCITGAQGGSAAEVLIAFNGDMPTTVYYDCSHVFGSTNYNTKPLITYSNQASKRGYFSGFITVSGGYATLWGTALRALATPISAHVYHVRVAKGNITAVDITSTNPVLAGTTVRLTRL